jgi:hypothetical protein
MSYKFYPPQRANSPGSPCLDMVIGEGPTDLRAGSHVLERAKLRIPSQQDLPETVTLSHPWPYANQQQVCIGNIALELVTAERVVAFTFGGIMQIQPQNGKTLFTLTSSAPILRLGDFNQISTILGNEVAILLAERRVEELPDLSEYNKTLLCAEPLELYCACLQALNEKYMDFSHPESLSMIEFSIFLTTEIETLRSADLWPNHLPELIELLQTN